MCNAALHELVEQQVDRTPDATAVLFRGDRLSYGELDARANRLAHHLIARGVTPGALVAVAMERSLELVATLLGILKAGAAYLPLDLELPRERWMFLLDDAAPALLITHEGLALPGRHASMLEVDRGWQRLGGEPATRVERLVDPAALAYVMYTSGSTGQPKGVMVGQRGVCNLLHWMRETFALGPDDHVLQKTPYFWDVSVPELFGPLVVGARLVVAEPGGHKDAAYLARVMVENAVTTVSFVPSVLRHFVDACPSPVASLRRVFVAGEALTPEIQERFFSRYTAELHNLYGPTEGTVYATHWACRRGSDAKSVPIGRPIANTTTHVLDERGQPVARGAVGELHLGGAGVARGYLARPELTAERFIRGPLGDDASAHLYRTGDLVSENEDGELEFHGRRDDQVKVHGNRIELGEIESALGRHPAVRECAAAPGQGRTSLVAYVVAVEGHAVEADELRRFLEAKLPRFMVPHAIHFVPSLPRTANGKLDRKSLRPPERPPAIAETAESALEHGVQLAWQQVFGKPIGMTDNFFAAGGDSLLAAELLCAVEQRFGANLPMSSLLRAPTPRALARLLTERSAPLSSCLVAVRPEGTRPPLYLVHGLDGNVWGHRLLVAQLDAALPIYGLQAVGLDATREPQSSIEEMAAHYVDAIRRVQPSGPYFLGGGSFGGNVAFEMACRLERSGQKVALLALFDSGLGRAALSTRALVAKELSMNLRKLAYHARAVLQLDRKEWLSYVGQRGRGIAERIKTVAWQRRFRRYRHASEPLPQRWRSITQLNWLAIHDYVPSSLFSGRTVLYRATEGNDLWLLGRDRTFGWGRFACDLEVVDVPGGHSEIVAEPNVQQLAADLMRRILAA